jgi:hypothetical protein
MTQDQDRDENLGALLRGAMGEALPERDPLFRLAVLERRERQRFQRRTLVLAIAAIAAALVFAFGFGAGANLLVTSLVALVLAALAASVAVSIPAVRELLRRLQRVSAKNA